MMVYGKTAPGTILNITQDMWFPLLNRRALLFAQSQYINNSLHLPTPNCQSIPPHIPLGDHKCVLYVKDSLCFVHRFTVISLIGKG